MQPSRWLMAFLVAVLFVSPTSVAFASKDAAEVSLAGEWRFRLDPDARGIAEEWYDQQLPDVISLPGSTDLAGYGAKGAKAVATQLSRLVEYEGPAWYQREIVIPQGSEGKRRVLFLERCHWETQVWVDGKAVGKQNSLSVPHEYDLTDFLTPGKHRLTIRVDNHYKINVGRNAHSLTEHTQTNWNGIVGRIELRTTDPVWIEDVQVFPNVEKRAAEVRGVIGNRTGREYEAGIMLKVAALGDDHAKPIKVVQRVSVGKEKQTSFAVELSMGADVKLWDEFSPSRYELAVGLAAGDQGEKLQNVKSVTFGMREFRADGKQFTINGRPVFLRGTLECCIFPQTGYPAMDVEAWLRIIRIAKSHGLNHIRFHSWCPPEAAFEAADREGFMLHVETPVWTVLGEDPKVDAFIYAEGDRIRRYYGNHPSFCLLCVGNEPSGDKQVEFLSKIVIYWKQTDPRRLYTGCSGWPRVPENDYQSSAAPRIYAWGDGLKCRVNAESLSTDNDYTDQAGRFPVPVVTHEMGQWCVYPDYREIKKYTGVLRAKNFEIFRESLEEHHMLDQANDFLIASGKLQTLLYKEDIEAALRTPSLGGFQLLDLHDFPGQGTALVGVLNAFWESKGYVTPAEFRRFCCETVPLVRMKKFTYTNDEALQATVVVAHYGSSPLHDAIVTWRLSDANGRDVSTGEFPARELPWGVSRIGDLVIPLSRVAAAAQLKLAFAIKGTEYANDWGVWVYPAKVDTTPAADVLVVDRLSPQAEQALAGGGKVLLLAPPETIRSDVPPGFSSIFWNTSWTERQPPHTLGILCSPKHPALVRFPTEFHSNWQWWDLVSKSRAMVLDDFPPAFRPLVQVIDDWNTNRKLGLVWEAQVAGGKLLMCSIDLRSKLDERPVARQMLHSLLEYMHSEAFAPHSRIDLGPARGLLK